MKRWSAAEKEEWVVQANELAEQHATKAILGLGLMERRVFAWLVAHLEDLRAETFPEQHLAVKDFAEEMGYASSNAGSLYSDMRRAADRLMTTLVRYPFPGHPGAWQVCQLLTDQVYHEGQGWFRLQIHPKMAPALLHLEKGFFRFKLENIGRLGSAYAVRLYEISKSREKQADGWYEYSLEELRRMLDVPENKLTTWQAFRRRALDYPLMQINAETDIRIQYQQKKRGRRVHSVLFRVRAARPAREPKAAKKEVESWRDFTPAEKAALWDWMRGQVRYLDLAQKEAWAEIAPEERELAAQAYLSDLRAARQQELFPR